MAYDQLGNYYPDTPDSTGGTSPTGGATLGVGASLQQPSGILQQYLAANQPQGSLPPMPPRRPMSLGVPGGNGGGSAGAGVPLPPRRPFDLGQLGQSVGAPMQLPGGYRPEGPPATSAQGGPFSGGNPFDALKSLFGGGPQGVMRPDMNGNPVNDVSMYLPKNPGDIGSDGLSKTPFGNSGEGSQGFANTHPNLPFSNLLKQNNSNNSPNRNILGRLAGLFGQGGLFGGGSGGGSTDFGVPGDALGEDILS